MSRKLINYFTKSDIARRKFNLLVEWTNHCNIRCSMCPIDSPTMRQKGHMSIDLWERVLDDCKEHGHYVNWVHHLGEPLLWKHFNEGMTMWKESGLSVKGHISTNGILMNKENIKIIRETGLDYIRVCIDTLRPDVYKSLRNNGNHALIIDNIHTLLDDAKDLNVQLQLMRTKLNEDESPNDFFNFFGHNKNIKVFYTTAMNLGKEIDYTLLNGVKSDPRRCDKIDFQHCVIGWDGTVGLCCGDYGLRNKLGDINTSTISEVFDGDYANKVRKMIKKGDYSLAPTCKTCSMDHVKPMIRELMGSK